MTYQIVDNETKRGQQKLVDSRGYTFIIVEAMLLTGSVQCGKSFIAGPSGHNHPAHVGSTIAAKVISIVKSKFKKDIFRPVPVIVHQVSYDKM